MKPETKNTLTLGVLVTATLASYIVSKPYETMRNLETIYQSSTQAIEKLNKVQEGFIGRG
jgi:hypothetical protein